MKKINFGFAILILFLISINTAKAQEKKDLLISFGIGGITTYANRSIESAQMGLGYLISANYFLTKKHSLTFDYIGGSHRYAYNPFQEMGISPPTSSGMASPTIVYHQFSLLFKYKIISAKRFDVAIGTGLSIQSYIDKRPDYSVRHEPATNSYFWHWSTFSTVAGTIPVLPLKAEVSFRLTDRLLAGVEGGLAYFPYNYLSAIHLIPRIGYLIR
ncbi:MAG: hypothetical protein OHK0057_37300 [Thermoflexibacter sp.]